MLDLFKDSDFISNTNQNLNLEILVQISSHQSSFDIGIEFKAVCLDTSKAFDEVQHEGLGLKWREFDFSDGVLRLLQSFLNVGSILNVQSCSWANVKAGVLESFILGILLLLIYMNDLLECLLSKEKVFTVHCFW